MRRWIIGLLVLAALGLWLLQDAPEQTVAATDAQPTTTASKRVEQADSLIARESSAKAGETAPNAAATRAAPPRPIVFDRDSARTAMQRLDDIEDCKAASSESWPRYWAVRTGVAWLPAEEQARNRATVKDARQRLLAACRRQGLSRRDDTAGKPRPSSLEQALDALAPELAAVEQTIEQAANAGDLQAQLSRQASNWRDADIDRETRPLLDAVLAEVIAGGDAGMLVDIGRIPAMNNGPALGPLASWYGLQQTAGEPNAHVNQRALWTLVACDLGMDCGASSPTLDRLCLLQGLCGYPDIEAAVRDGMITGAEAAETELRRQWAVARIRRGEIAGMFDPAPPPTPGGRP